jgi:hypothetical protein
MSLTVTVQKGHDFSSGNITRATLNAGAVPTVAVTGSVSTTELVDGGVTADKLATDAVENANIKDGAVTETKLGAASVVLGKLGPASVVASNILVLKDATLPANANIIDGLTEVTGDVAVDDYLIVHDTSASTEGARQLFKAKVSAVQKVGTTEYVMSAQDTAGGPTMGGSGTALTVAVDMDGSPFQTLVLVGGSTYTFSSLANRSGTAVKTVTLKLTHSGSGAANLAGHTNWNWPERESGHPTSLPASKVALLSLTSFGTADGDVMAAYAVTV